MSKRHSRGTPDLGEMSVCCLSQPVSVLTLLADQGSLEVQLARHPEPLMPKKEATKQHQNKTKPLNVFHALLTFTAVVGCRQSVGDS